MGRARRLVRTAVAGAVFSGVPSGVAWALGHGDPLEATREIGRFWTGGPTLVGGAAGHLAISTILAIPAPWLARTRSPVLAGALYGALLYGVDFKLVAPRLWPELLRHAGAVQAADHLAFGIVVATAAAQGVGVTRSDPRNPIVRTANGGRTASQNHDSLEGWDPPSEACSSRHSPPRSSERRRPLPKSSPRGTTAPGPAGIRTSPD